MQITQSLCIQLTVLITGGLMQCLALNQIIITQGDTLTLTCRVKNNTNLTDALEWRTPGNFVLFFNRHKVLRDKRSKLVKLTESEYTIHVTDITFKDGGVYSCLRYAKELSVKRFKVNVVGAPVLEMYEQEDKITVKCSASANEHPPQLSWVIDNRLELEAQPYYEFINRTNKHTAIGQLNIKVPKKRVTLKCVALHSVLHGIQLENFIHLGNPSPETTESSSHATQTTPNHKTLESTDTTVKQTLFNITINETTEGTSLNGSKAISNNTSVNETTQSISETTDSTLWSSSSNTTVKENWNDRQLVKKQNSTLLVLLVTCLIVCLLMVLTLFLVLLRSKYIAWKKENEDSDQSVESSRSKSSNEEKQRQQRAQGLQNTIFSKYKAEETVTNEAQPTPALVQVINKIPQHFISRSSVKETDL